MVNTNTDVFHKKHIKSWKQGPDGYKGWAKRAAGKLRRCEGRTTCRAYLKGDYDG